MTADDVKRVMIVLSEAMADRGIRVEDRRAIEVEVQERLCELIECSPGSAQPLWSTLVTALPRADDWERAVAWTRQQYPEDVFLPGSTTEDGKAGCFARLICDNIVHRAMRYASLREESRK